MLTESQLQAIKSHIDNTPELAAQPLTSDGAFAIAAVLNAAASPAFTVWNPTASIDQVQDAVKWANLTPADPVPTSGADAIATWTARSLSCQGKQFNLQMLLTRPSGTIRGDLSLIRTALQDALSNVPSALGGGGQDAGWSPNGVRLALQRTALLVEKILATGTGTAVSPATMSYVGTLTYQDVEQARAI